MSVQDTVGAIWTELKSKGWNTKGIVNYIYEEFGDYDDLESVLFTVVGAKNWPEVSDAIPRMTYEPDSKLYGCQTDEYGYAIDPYSFQRIPESRLITYVSEGKKWCFDINSLYEQLGRSGRMVNPYNNQPLPDEVISKVYASDRGTDVPVIGTNAVIIQKRYHKYGDIIVMVMFAVGDNPLEMIMDYDVASSVATELAPASRSSDVVGTTSIYSHNLKDTVPQPLESLTLQPYGDDVTKRNKNLLELFRYSKGSTETNIRYNTVYHFIGALLRLVPIFTDLDIDIRPEDTVGDVIIKALKSYGGYHLWNVMDLVYEGVSLYESDMNALLVDVAPNTEIHVVQVEHDDHQLLMDIKHNLRLLARETNDQELMNAIGIPTIEWLKENVKIVSDIDIRTGLRLTDDPKKYIDDLVTWISTLGEESERMLDMLSFLFFGGEDYTDLIYDALSRIDIHTVDPDFAFSRYSNFMSDGSYPGTTDSYAAEFNSFAKSIREGIYPPAPSRKVIAHLDDVTVLKHYIDIGYITTSATVSSGIPTTSSWDTLTTRDIFLWSIDVIKSKIVRYMVDNNLVDLTDIVNLVYVDDDAVTMHSFIVSLFMGPGVPQSLRDYVIKNDKILLWMAESLKHLRCGKESCVLAILRNFTTVDNITSILPHLHMNSVDYNEAYLMYTSREWTNKDDRYKFLYDILKFVSVDTIMESFAGVSEEVKNEVLTILIVQGYRGLSYMNIIPTRGLVLTILNKSHPNHGTITYLSNDEAQTVMMNLLHGHTSVPIVYLNTQSIRTLIVDGVISLREVASDPVLRNKSLNTFRNDEEVQEVVLRCIRSSGTDLTCPIFYLSDENAMTILADPRTDISIVESLLHNRELASLPLNRNVVTTIAYNHSLWHHSGKVYSRLKDNDFKYDDGSVVDQQLVMDLEKVSGTTAPTWSWGVSDMSAILGRGVTSY